ncbi:MAG: hypothetical protein QM758_05685 [Armatimonas sp.]
MNKRHFLFFASGTLAAMSVTLALSSLARAQFGAGLIREITAEHNRIRQHPKMVADELRHARATLIQSRVHGGESAADATRAIDDCIHDLDALATKFPNGLPTLAVAPAGNTYAQRCVDTMPGSTHATPMDINAGWKANGYVGLATAESITSFPDHGSDKEKAKIVVQGLLIDWGHSNILTGYGHRKFILDYETPSAPPKPGYAKKFKAIGIGISRIGRVRIQYGLN